MNTKWRVRDLPMRTRTGAWFDGPVGAKREPAVRRIAGPWPSRVTRTAAGMTAEPLALPVARS